MSHEVLLEANRNLQKEAGEAGKSSFDFIRPLIAKIKGEMDELVRNEDGKGGAMAGLFCGAVTGFGLYFLSGFGAEMIAPPSMMQQIGNSVNWTHLAIATVIGGAVGAVLIGSVDDSFNGGSR